VFQPVSLSSSEQHQTEFVWSPESSPSQWRFVREVNALLWRDRRDLWIVPLGSSIHAANKTSIGYERLQTSTQTQFEPV